MEESERRRQPSGAAAPLPGYGHAECVSRGAAGAGCGGDGKQRSIEGTGEYTAEAAGRLTLRFDNSFTRLWAKSVLYSLSICKANSTLDTVLPVGLP